MQPLEKKRVQNQKNGSRARLLLSKDAHWLPGYPIRFEADAVIWQAFPWESPGDTATLKLDREQLRRAQLAMSKLQHQFPRVLEKLVHDVDGWTRRTASLLDVLKSWLHRQQATRLNSLLESGCFSHRWQTKLRRLHQNPALEPLCESIVFLELSRRSAPDLGVLDWIERNQRLLAKIKQSASLSPDEALLVQLQLCACREQLPPELLDKLARCFFDVRLFDCPVEDCEQYLLRLTVRFEKVAKSRRSKGGFASKTDFPERSSTTKLGMEILRILRQSLAAATHRRRRLLQLLGRLLTNQTLYLASQLHGDLSVQERRVEKSLRHLLHHDDLTKFEIKQHSAGVAAVTVAAKPKETVQQLGTCLRTIQNMDHATIDCLCEFATSIPDELSALCVGLLAKWLCFLQRPATNRDEFYGHLNPVTRLIRRRGVAAGLVSYWREVTKTHRSEFVIDFHHERLPPAEAVRAVAVLEGAVFDREVELGRNLLDSLSSFVQSNADVRLITSVVVELAAGKDEVFGEGDATVAFALARDPVEVAGLLRKLDASSNLHGLLVKLESLTQHDDLRALLVRLLLQGEESSARQFCRLHTLQAHLQLPLFILDPVACDDGWVRGYPTSLHAPLSHLARITDDSQRIANEILRKEFPTRSKLVGQIEFIQRALASSKQPDERLQRKLANLQARVACEHESTLSPKRLENLTAKIERRCDLELLDRYLQQGHQQVAACLQSRYGCDQFPDWLLTAPFEQILAAVFELRSGTRELGLRLLFESLQRTTRGFEEESANAKFRQQMETRGVRMEPWLGDEVRLTAHADDGTPYELAFTRDVADFLLMGFHFDTCLAPDSCNFFSTVANAVDINKRVVFGKTKSGQLIGRCLFALNDDGSVLTYHRYSRGRQTGFSQAVDQFAKQLVVNMRTQLSTRGHVRSLVAKEWYDDGAVGFIGDLSQDSHPVRELIRNSHPTTTLQAMLTEFPRMEISDRLSEIVCMDEVAARPVLFRDLLREFADEPHTPKRDVLRLATIAFRGDASEIAFSILNRLRPKTILRHVQQTRCDDCSEFHGIGTYQDVFAMMCAYQSSLAMRVIRASQTVEARRNVSDRNVARRTAIANVRRLHPVGKNLRRRASRY